MVPKLLFMDTPDDILQNDVHPSSFKHGQFIAKNKRPSSAEEQLAALVRSSVKQTAVMLGDFVAFDEHGPYRCVPSFSWAYTVLIFVFLGQFHDA
jgi:hypothetical protein